MCIRMYVGIIYASDVKCIEEGLGMYVRTLMKEARAT